MSEAQDCLKVLAVAQLSGESPKAFIGRVVVFQNGKYAYRGIIKGFSITERAGLVFTAVPHDQSEITREVRPDEILQVGPA